MDAESAIAAVRLLTRALEALKALLELLRQRGRDRDDASHEARRRPRHLKE